MKHLSKTYKIAAVYATIVLIPFMAIAQHKKNPHKNSKTKEQLKKERFEKTFRTKNTDSIPIYLNQFLKLYPNAINEPDYRGDALYGNIAQRMAEEKKWDQYDIYHAKLSTAASTDLDYGTAVDLFKSNGDFQVAERLALRAVQQYEKTNSADLPKDGKPDSIFLKNEEERSRGINKRVYQDGKPDSTLVNNEKIRTYGNMASLYAELAYRNQHNSLGMPYALKASYILGDSVRELYLKLLSRTAAPEVALSAIEEHYRAGKLNDDELPAIVGGLFKKLHPSGEGFLAYYDGLRSQLLNATRERLIKEKLSIPAPDFKLLNMSGNAVKLSELKGKTVIIDFWATWCYYCKKGFPAMQIVMDTYSSDKNVVFLFINTQESLNESSRKKQITDYLKANKFNFNVLLDTRVKPDYDVVNAYKVDGLPTKFIIGPDGQIAFKEVGYSGSDEKLINDLSTMIDLAKKTVPNP
ncbi:TlpA family protein disulfide reductase [Pedobacter sp. N23S346]|uniref:TlpA family protein disulfide reductase n=1 Tax=Pedobacter sp. N23S346 TaxID=3402750 RepID=UPI003AD1F3D7